MVRVVWVEVAAVMEEEGQEAALEGLEGLEGALAHV